MWKFHRTISNRFVYMDSKWYLKYGRKNWIFSEIAGLIENERRFMQISGRCREISASYILRWNVETHCCLLWVGEPLRIENQVRRFTDIGNVSRETQNSPVDVKWLTCIHKSWWQQRRRWLSGSGCVRVTYLILLYYYFCRRKWRHGVVGNRLFNIVYLTCLNREVSETKWSHYLALIVPTPAFDRSFKRL